LKDSQLIPINYILKFALIAFFFLAISTAQYILKFVDDYYNGSKFNEFVDLCTIANISLVIIEEH
jgi:hypothetical protein